jgi:hypothetical protein
VAGDNFCYGTELTCGIFLSVIREGKGLLDFSAISFNDIRKCDLLAMIMHELLFHSLVSIHVV